MFAYKPALVGLSKSKILFVGIIIIVGVMAILIWGTMSNTKIKDIQPYSESLYFSNSNSLNSANAIIEKALESRLKNNFIQSNNNSLPLNESISKIATNGTIVPPLINNDEKSNQAIHELKHKISNQIQENDNTVIFKSKTVVFTANPSLYNSNNLQANKSQSSDVIYPNKTNLTNAQVLNEDMKHSVTNESNSKFLDKSVLSTDYLNSEIQAPISPYELKAGSVIPAIMVNGINSDLPGQVVALVRENVYDSIARRYLLIPQGAKLVGLYDSKITYGQTRLLVAWNRIIYQDGSSLNLKAMPGTDLAGYSGFYDEVDNKYWQIFGTSFIMGVLTGAMQYSQNNTNANVQSGGIGITTDNNPTVGQTLSGSLGQQLGQTGLSITQKNLNVQPTIIIKPNYPFNIMITADIILKPYKS